MNDGKFVGWRKSSHSGDGNSCVEVAILVQPEPRCSNRARGVGVRDSQQDSRGPVLEFGRAAWTEFIVRAVNRLSLGGRRPRPVTMSGGHPPRVAWRMIERPGHGQGLCSCVCESIIGTFANPVRRSIVFKPSSGREERR